MSHDTTQEEHELHRMNGQLLPLVQVYTLLDQLATNELEPNETEMLRQHLAQCQTCSQMYLELGHYHRLLRGVMSHDAPVSAIDQAPEAQPIPPLGQPAEPALPPSRPRRMPGLFRRTGTRLLIAAVVLVVIVADLLIFRNILPQTQHTHTTNAHGTPTTTEVSTATAAPEPTPTPGAYIISEKTFYSAQVSKLDPHTRRPIWTQPVGAMGSPLSSDLDPFTPTSMPAVVVYGNTLYVVSGDTDPSGDNNYVYAIDASSGAIRWKKLVSNDVFTSPQYGGPYNLGALSQPTIAQGILFVAARDGKLYALDAATGAQRWVYNAHTSTFVNGFLSDANPVAVVRGVVYGATHNVLYALDARSGKPLWTRQIAETQFFNAPTLVNSVLYLSSRAAYYGGEPQLQSSVISAYASKDGQPRWQHPLNMAVLAAPTAANGIVYFGSYDHNLYALKAGDGSELWHYNTGGEIFEQPIIENGIIYTDELGTQYGISSDSTMLFAINASIGKLVWKKSVANMLALEQVQAGVIYVGIWPGQLAALSVKDGLILWQQHYGATLIDKTGTESEMPAMITVIS